MKQFVFLYPIPEYINWEIENGSYGWDCKPWMNKWEKIFENLNEEERDKTRPKALKEKQARFRPHYSRILNKCIDKRYREKGFKINWVIFKDHTISNVIDVQDGDIIIEADIDFRTHTTKRVDGTYQYPNNDFILNHIGDSSLVRIAGFHRWDCVDKLAKRAYERKNSVLVDEDLTEMFYGRFKDKNFRVDKYPTYNPRQFDTKEDDYLFKQFMKARENKPWLWQDY
ncbi:MAG: hypothetical protein ABIA78_01930 [archaeon]